MRIHRHGQLPIMRADSAFGAVSAWEGNWPAVTFGDRRTLACLESAS
jgi:hypothetical protein